MGGIKVYSNGCGHMSKMATMPIYGENLKNFFPGTKKLVILKISMEHWVVEYYQIC